MIEILEKYGLTEAGKDYAWFDSESFDDSDNYQYLIEDLSEISKGKFQPENVIISEGRTNNDENYIVEIQFELENKAETIKVLGEEWFDINLIHSLNQILSKHGIDERFYSIKTEDQTLIIVFIDNLLKEKFSEEKIIEEDY